MSGVSFVCETKCRLKISAKKEPQS